MKKGTYAGAGSLGGLAFGSTILLIPMIAFFNLWSNWGATLYGEVRGASDFRKNIIAMAGALVVTTHRRRDLPAPDRPHDGLELLQLGEQRVVERHGLDGRRVAVPGHACDRSSSVRGCSSSSSC